MRLVTITAAMLCLAASGAMAKGHAQSNTDVPGADDVGSRTVATAQILGGAKGNRPEGAGPSANNPAVGNAGR